MIEFIGIWTVTIILGIFALLSVGATHHAIVKEKWSSFFLSMPASIMLIILTVQVGEKASNVKVPGTIRTQCKQREWVKIPKEAKGVKYEVEEIRCKEYYPSWIYIDGEWKEMVEDKK